MGNSLSGGVTSESETVQKASCLLLPAFRGGWVGRNGKATASGPNMKVRAPYIQVTGLELQY